MARSLNVNHDERPATSPLLTAFLVLVVAWLGLGTVLVAAFGTTAEAAPVAPAQVDVP